MEKIPKYELVRKDLLALIENGTYAPGMELPSETDLIKKYNVSRITVRRALDELYLNNYIEKKQGKRACVKATKKVQSLDGISSYTEEIQAQGMTPSRKVISSGLRLSTSDEQESLNLDKADPVYYLERVIYADGTPLCYTTTAIPYNYFRDIEQYDFSIQSLYNIMESAYKIKITSSSLKLKALPAKGRIADYLDMEKGSPLLYYSGITSALINGQEQPVEYFTTYYSTDLFEYSLTQKR